MKLDVLIGRVRVVTKGFRLVLEVIFYVLVTIGLLPFYILTLLIDA